MLAKLWLFPDGTIFDIGQVDKEIERVMQMVEAQVLGVGVHNIGVSGMIDQLNTYTVNVTDRGALLTIAPVPGLVGASRLIRLPKDTPQVPILSGKRDGNSYIFALIDVSKS